MSKGENFSASQTSYKLRNIVTLRFHLRYLQRYIQRIWCAAVGGMGGASGYGEYASSKMNTSNAFCELFLPFLFLGEFMWSRLKALTALRTVTASTCTALSSSRKWILIIAYRGRAHSFISSPWSIFSHGKIFSFSSRVSRALVLSSSFFAQITFRTSCEWYTTRTMDESIAIYWA